MPGDDFRLWGVTLPGEEDEKWRMKIVFRIPVISPGVYRFCGNQRDGEKYKRPV
jgi:hypothetical protein